MTWESQARCAGILNFTNYPAHHTARYCRECPVKAACRASGMMPHHITTPKPRTAPKRPVKTPNTTVAAKAAKRIQEVTAAIDAGDPGWLIAHRYGLQPDSLYRWLRRNGQHDLAVAILESRQAA